jgi:hypothetical protein
MPIMSRYASTALALALVVHSSPLSWLQMGEDGNPAAPLPHAAEKCCIAVAHPKAREGYFEVCLPSFTRTFACRT